MEHAVSCEVTISGIKEGAVDSFILYNEGLIQSGLSAEAYAEGPLGWFDPNTSMQSLQAIQSLAARVQARFDLLIVIGIGGSNRGAVAAVGALSPTGTELFFAGDTLSATQLAKAIRLVQERNAALCVIAKDFNTIEPGITFRMLRKELERKYGSSSHERIIAIGSGGEGQLHHLAQRHQWEFLAFPADINGRYSVLSTVGLFPMAVAGVDIESLIAGGIAEHQRLTTLKPLMNPAVRYAAVRNLLSKQGSIIEALVIFEPALEGFARWWVQLFGESEGKKEGALFPTYFSYSEDLHAIGQYVQEGPRIIVETFLNYTYKSSPLVIEPSCEIQDRFDYLDDRPFDTLNEVVYQAALNAHASDHRPVIELSSSQSISAYSLGQSFYFFLFSVYLSSLLLGVNPFTQDGVEGYKKNMYHQLGKGKVWPD